MKTRTDRLAKGKNLTPEEQKARLAIAVISKTIARETKGTSGEQLISEGTKNLREKISSLGSPNVSGDDGLNAPKANSAGINRAATDQNAAAPNAAR